MSVVVGTPADAGVPAPLGRGSSPEVTVHPRPRESAREVRPGSRSTERQLMRILLVGAGGVGSAFAAIAARRDFFDTIVIADYAEASALRAAEADER